MPGFARPSSGVIAGNVYYAPSGTISSNNVDGAIKELEYDIANNTGGAGAVGGGTDLVFFENDKTVTTSYTITTDKNAVSAGPITINDGVTITVPSGSVWVIV